MSASLEYPERFTLVRDTTEALVLQHLRPGRPLSKGELARRTGLSVPTVTKVIQKFEQDCTVVVDSVGGSAGGRRPLLYRFNGTVATVAGVLIRDGWIEVAGCAADGQVFLLRNRPLSFLGSKLLLEDALDFLAECFRDTGVTRTLKRIGLATAGVVNRETGVVERALNFGWDNVPVRSLAEEQFGVPVLIENDTNAAAYGAIMENRNRGGDDETLPRDLIYVMIGTGIGAGLVMGGEVQRGSHSRAGEIAHIVVDPAGPECRCGKRGCLEVMGSTIAILKRVYGEGMKGIPSTGVLSLDAYSVRQACHQLLARAEEGDDQVRRVLRDAAQALATAIGNLVAAVDPSQVVLDGPLVREDGFFFETLRDLILSRSLPLVTFDVSVATAEGRAATHGMMMMALDHIFMPGDKEQLGEMRVSRQGERQAQ